MSIGASDNHNVSRPNITIKSIICAYGTPPPPKKNPQNPAFLISSRFWRTLQYSIILTHIHPPPTPPHPERNNYLQQYTVICWKKYVQLQARMLATSKHMVIKIMHGDL